MERVQKENMAAHFTKQGEEMKIRAGFVSNSSSSSFVCDVCNRQYLQCPCEEVRYECELGHEICGKCMSFKKIEFLAKNIDVAVKDLKLDNISTNELVSEENKEEWIKDNFIRNDLMYSSLCPICNLTHISPDMELQYLLEKFDVKISNVHNEIREKYKNKEEWERRNED
jgi:hypothetical protein